MIRNGGISNSKVWEREEKWGKGWMGKRERGERERERERERDRERERERERESGMKTRRLSVA